VCGVHLGNWDWVRRTRSRFFSLDLELQVGVINCTYRTAVEAKFLNNSSTVTRPHTRINSSLFSKFPSVDAVRVMSRP
jgi:hypothetical protein